MVVTESTQHENPMKTLLLGALFTVVASLGIASLSGSADAGDAPPCKSKEFKTESVKAACAKGGQKEAKAQMQKFMKEAKMKSCNGCHTKLAPDYPLKADGLKKYHELGGK